ncbi:MAG: glycosyltransferase family 4 protein [Anaerolineales bacterium]
MHLLFVHKNFPAQFGHIARALVRRGHRCTFVSETPAGRVDGIEKITYRIRGGATPKTHYCARTFENATWHTHAVYEALAARPDIHPDLIVGHSGFGSTLFLADLYPDTPIINYFEYYYHARNSDLDFRPEWPAKPLDRLRSQTRNAMILLDLETCAAGYTPTRFQYGLFPEAYRPKLHVIHDGIDTALWRPATPDDPVLSLQIPPDAYVITYVARGFEAMRGFDIFMQAAKRIYRANPRAHFFIVGEDRVAYGGDLRHIPGGSFKQYVMQQDDYDLRHLHFLGYLPPTTLARLLAHSDLHIYLTVPFVLSWSLLNAMACGCTILASDTAPVLEVIQDGENGLLCHFFDADALAESALRVLQDPQAHRRSLGTAARRTIEARYALSVTLPQLLTLFESTLHPL